MVLKPLARETKRRYAQPKKASSTKRQSNAIINVLRLIEIGGNEEHFFEELKRLGLDATIAKGRTKLANVVENSRTINIPLREGVILIRVDRDLREILRLIDRARKNALVKNGYSNLEDEYGRKLYVSLGSLFEFLLNKKSLKLLELGVNPIAWAKRAIAFLASADGTIAISNILWLGKRKIEVSIPFVFIDRRVELPAKIKKENTSRKELFLGDKPLFSWIRETLRKKPVGKIYKARLLELINKIQRGSLRLLLYQKGKDIYGVLMSDDVRFSHYGRIEVAVEKVGEAYEPNQGVLGLLDISINSSPILLYSLADDFEIYTDTMREAGRFMDEDKSAVFDISLILLKGANSTIGSLYGFVGEIQTSDKANFGEGDIKETHSQRVWRDKQFACVAEKLIQLSNMEGTGIKIFSLGKSAKISVFREKNNYFLELEGVSAPFGKINRAIFVSKDKDFIFKVSGIYLDLMDGEAVIFDKNDVVLGDVPMDACLAMKGRILCKKRGLFYVRVNLSEPSPTDIVEEAEKSSIELSDQIKSINIKRKILEATLKNGEKISILIMGLAGSFRTSLNLEELLKTLKEKCGFEPKKIKFSYGDIYVLYALESPEGKLIIEQLSQK